MAIPTWIWERSSPWWLAGQHVVAGVKKSLSYLKMVVDFRPALTGFLSHYTGCTQMNIVNVINKIVALYF